MEMGMELSMVMQEEEEVVQWIQKKVMVERGRMKRVMKKKVVHNLVIA